MTSERRVERLTREALGAPKRENYSKFDDALLRAIGIVVLIVTVIAFASWPRGEAPRARHVTKTSANTAPLAAALVVTDYTPIY